MHQLINEISTLSDNSAVFDHLRVGCDLMALANLPADSFAIPRKTVKGELLHAFRHAIVLALQANDHSSLDSLIDDVDINARITIFGELILTLYALRDGEHSDDNPSFPEFEKVAALYWLHRACEEFCRLVPTDTDTAHQLQRVHDLHKERGYPNDISAPRFGPIAKTYLDKTPYLALIIRDLQENSENVAVICQRYGCPSLDVDFYLSAMGSYVIRDTILRDVHIYYDEVHHEVFAAIDYLQHQNQQTGTDGAEQNTPGNSSHE